MEAVIEYIEKITGENLHVVKIPKNDLDLQLPFYLLEMYHFYKTELFGQTIVLYKFKDEDNFSIQQLTKHQFIVNQKLKALPVVVLQHIKAFQRARLIENKVQFIVPNRQLFMPYVFVDVNERFTRKQEKRETLLPIAQLIVLKHFLSANSNVRIENLSFKKLAKSLGYSPMAITKAANNLVSLGLCEIEEFQRIKLIHFVENKQPLWQRVEPHLINPVLKTVYIDSLPNNLKLLQANFSALPEYSEVNPSRQQYYAIEKTAFYALQRSNALINANDKEGNYALEVWKYNPVILAEIVESNATVVDPLSLYLSIREGVDERTEMALEHMINNLIW